MGFVRIASVETPQEAREIWNCFLDLSDMNQEGRFYSISYNIQNGGRFFLKANQSFVLFLGEKFVDAIVGPGMFVYLDVFENGKCDALEEKHTMILRDKNPEFFADDISQEVQIEGIVFNRQEGKPIRFAFDEARYYDKQRDMDIVLQGSGYFVLTQAEPLVNYALSQFDKKRMLENTLPEFSDEEICQLASDLENAFEKTLVKLSNSRFSYERLPYVTDSLTSFVNEELDNSWVLGKGIMAKTIEFTAFYPDEKSMLGLVEYERMKRSEKTVTPQPTSQSQNVNPQQNINYQQNMNYQPTYGNQGMPQEYIIKTGSCDWYKDGTSTMQGKATLTNKRFSFVTSKLAQVDKMLFSQLDEGNRGFEFLLSDVLNIMEDNQGTSYALIFKLKNGVCYKCSFSKFFTITTGEWLASILDVLK